MRTYPHAVHGLVIGPLLLCLVACARGIEPRATTGDDEAGFVSLFSQDGEPEGWAVRQWADVSQPAPDGARWVVRDGVLQGSEPRGTWLISDREYGDFELEFEFKLGPRGNSGCALRSPPRGDPAFDGLELQMADVRYNSDATPSELTGGLYRALAPTGQVYRPTEWNAYHIRLVGPHITVVLERLHHS